MCVVSAATPQAWPRAGPRAQARPDRAGVAAAAGSPTFFLEIVSVLSTQICRTSTNRLGSDQCEKGSADPELELPPTARPSRERFERGVGCACIAAGGGDEGQRVPGSSVAWSRKSASCLLTPPNSEMGRERVYTRHPPLYTLHPTPHTLKTERKEGG